MKKTIIILLLALSSTAYAGWSEPEGRQFQIGCIESDLFALNLYSPGRTNA